MLNEFPIFNDQEVKTTVIEGEVAEVEEEGEEGKGEVREKSEF